MINTVFNHYILTNGYSSVTKTTMLTFVLPMQ